MGIVAWYRKMAMKVKAFPEGKFWKFMLAKVFGSFALGLLFAAYIGGVDWKLVGWIILAVCILVSLPETMELFKGDKKSAPATGQ